ncbi:MAG: imidazole glycerol phosphate synthase subunit HisF, partial [Pseudomonas sp. PGPPP3]
MLRPRIIPCLLVKDGGLVKTVNFGKPKYVGDPINAVRIFNEKEVDELTVLDIDATALRREPDYKLIADLAAECRMPLCYGGGVTTAAQVQRIIGLGVEKVAVSAAAIATPALISEAAAHDAVLRLDQALAAQPFAGFREAVPAFVNLLVATGHDPAVLAAQLEALGAGEVVINAIDRDGEMKGYDLELAHRIREVITVPMTVLGGAGSLADVS